MNEIQGLENYPQETNSEAAKNYAAAAFLVGLAVMAVGAGVGYLMTAVRGTPEKGDKK